MWSNLNLFDENLQATDDQPSDEREHRVTASIDRLASTDLPNAGGDSIGEKGLPCTGSAECSETAHRREVAINGERTVMSVAINGAEPRVADRTRLQANGHRTTARKIDLGQFMTSPSIAQFMASLFSQPQVPVRLPDAGAGEGS